MTGQSPARRRRLSLRARLLAGLIALTACFLIIMGAVSSLSLGRLEQNQLNSDVRIASRQSVPGIERSGGFYAAYLSLRTGQTGVLTPAFSPSYQLRGFLSGLSGDTRVQARAALAARGPTFTLPGHDPLRVAWRVVPARAAGASRSGLPAGPAVIVVGRPVHAVASHVRGLVVTELITGGTLLVLLVVCGSWLIGRGLAPLDRMASTAGQITGGGDLAARMPGGDGRHETGRLAAAINTMLDRIQQSFRARLESEEKVRQFAADASHELRTPLTTIRGYAELYRQGAIGPDEMPNAMRRIESEAERMSLLVAELLELARLDRASSLDLAGTDLSELARDAAADARAVEPDRPVTADVPPSLVVTADEARIRQVLANLLANVRAHTPPGTPATVRASRYSGGVTLEVADEGPGMTEQDAALAFNRFYRSEQAGGPGSGLGLAIVQAIAAAHGGQARLISAPGRGTSVRIHLPAERI
ncbi:MAG: HAMP domain-containing histidine kinase [Streptosporangiales bacterium]|nr:HAMP domain-containing histidine kinase [Streptosporangiales bacterium]